MILIFQSYAYARICDLSFAVYLCVILASIINRFKINQIETSVIIYIVCHIEISKLIKILLESIGNYLRVRSKTVVKGVIRKHVIFIICC